MKKIYINNIHKYINKKITLSAWVDKIRDLPYVQFIVLRDGTGKVQVTIEKNEQNSRLNQIVSSLTLESIITVKGVLTKNEHVKLNGMEIIPTDIIIDNLANPNLPIDINDKDKALRETRLDYRFLDLRREDNLLLFKIQTAIEMAMREYWIKNNYIEIHSPKIGGASAESGALEFKLDYFGNKASLAQSPQFYKQMAMAAGFNKVFEIGPAFRAENSHTSYHASEIWMIDIEIAWINNVNDVMDEVERWVKYFMRKLKKEYGEEIKNVFNVEVSEVKNKFPRISFADAKKIIKEKYNYVAEKENDFDRREEELICKYAKEKYNSDFVFITKYPFEARPFYHMLDKNGLTESYDLLFKGLEIATGAQREHRYDILKKQVVEKGINIKSLNFYLDFFKYGCPPHGGMGFGLGRLLMQIFEIDNIREVTYVYRGPSRLYP
ncbi:MAG: aspartate--tRNA(Asn) ligase [Bacilli bacterium]